MSIETPLRALPAQPSLEHLRKEAKQLLVSLRRRAASAQLADAQLLVARAYGHASWRALKQDVDLRRTALGLMPPLSLADGLPRRRPARAHPWVPNADEAEQGFFLCALSIMSMQMVMPLTAFIAFVMQDLHFLHMP